MLVLCVSVFYLETFKMDVGGILSMSVCQISSQLREYDMLPISVTSNNTP